MRRCLGLWVLLVGFAFLVTSAATAAVHNFSAVMNGPSEFPVNASPGTGFGTFVYDDVAHTFSYDVSFSGLTGTTTAAHIHAPTTAPFFQNAGVATEVPYFTGFPIGVMSGTFVSVVDLTQAGSWNPTYITNNGGTTATAEAAFILAIRERKAYFNIHTSTFGGGEIRGFLIPEPGAMALMVLGTTSIGFVARRRRR
jgi:hypothetical protein